MSHIQSVSQRLIIFYLIFSLLLIVLSMAESERRVDPRDERRRKKELDEARKAGTVAPETDEDGNAINPHIPSYIKEAPCSSSPRLRSSSAALRLLLDLAPLSSLILLNVPLLKSPIKIEFSH